MMKIICIFLFDFCFEYFISIADFFWWLGISTETQVVESPPPGIDFGNCREEEDGLCCLGYVIFICIEYIGYNLFCGRGH